MLGGSGLFPRHSDNDKNSLLPGFEVDFEPLPDDLDLAGEAHQGFKSHWFKRAPRASRRWHSEPLSCCSALAYSNIRFSSLSHEPPPETPEHCAARLWLPGNPAVCYRLRRSRVHLGNVGLNENIGQNDFTNVNFKRKELCAMKCIAKLLAAALILFLADLSVADAAKVCKPTQYGLGQLRPTESLSKAQAKLDWSIRVAKKYTTKFANWGNASNRSLPCTTKTTPVGVNAYSCKAKAKPCAYE